VLKILLSWTFPLVIPAIAMLTAILLVWLIETPMALAIGIIVAAAVVVLTLHDRIRFVRMMFSYINKDPLVFLVGLTVVCGQLLAAGLLIWGIASRLQH
jgi:hypothetical protein